MKNCSIILILYCLLKNNILFGQCNVDDYKALRAFYLSTNGDNWKNKDNWNVQSENPPSNCNLGVFKGVYLNQVGRVTAIALSQNNLTGTLPSEIKNLKYLNTVWLDQNSITGTIPKEIGELQYLERIALSYNKFVGEIPKEFYSITTLKEFSFGINNITGSIPSDIKNLQNLIRLELSNNKLSGALPSEIGDLPFLENIDLSNNDFEGCFPSSFKSFCTKTTNFNGNMLLGDWLSFCKSPSKCVFNYKFKEIAFKLDTLFTSQSPNKKQMIFIPEGFTKDEFPKFYSFVVKMTSKLKEHFPGISFEAVLAYVPSNESGISNSFSNPKIIKDTYFETDHTLNGFGQPSVTINDKITTPFLKNYFPESKYPVLNRIITYIANTELYGAYNASSENIFTNFYISNEQNIGTLNDAEWVFAHELGHLFTLADTQDGHVIPQGERPNSTRETDRNKIKWKNLIKDSTPVPTPKDGKYNNDIGLFSVVDKENKPTGWYRPSNDSCIMESPSAHKSFCKVCSKHLDRNDNLPFVSIENGKFSGYFYAGSKVEIKAIAPDELSIFSHWEGNGVTFENGFRTSTSFIMPNKNIRIKAVYKSVCTHTAKINIPNGTSFCAGSSVNISAEAIGINSPFIFKWKQGTNEVGSGAFISLNKAGTYTVEVIDRQGCTIATSIDITQATDLSVNITGNDTFCSGQNTTLVANITEGMSPFTFQWKKNSANIGTNSNSLIISTEGSYSVTIKDNKGCIGNSKSYSVIQKTSPDVTISKSGMTDLLTGGSVVLSVPMINNQTYQWLKNSVVILGANGNSHTVKDGGVYSVTVEGNGCTATSEEVSVNLILANEALNESKDFKVFPNPVESILRVVIQNSLSKPADFNLINSLGFIVKEWKVKQQDNSFNITGLSAGVYIIRCQINDKISYQKIIKQ